MAETRSHFWASHLWASLGDLKSWEVKYLLWKQCWSAARHGKWSFSSTLTMLCLLALTCEEKQKRFLSCKVARKRMDAIDLSRLQNKQRYTQNMLGKPVILQHQASLPHCLNSVAQTVAVLPQISELWTKVQANPLLFHSSCSLFKTCDPCWFMQVGIPIIPALSLSLWVLALSTSTDYVAWGDRKQSKWQPACSSLSLFKLICTDENNIELNWWNCYFYRSKTLTIGYFIWFTLIFQGEV